MFIVHLFSIIYIWLDSLHLTCYEYSSTMFV